MSTAINVATRRERNQVLKDSEQTLSSFKSSVLDKDKEITKLQIDISTKLLISKRTGKWKIISCGQDITDQLLTKHTKIEL